VSLLFCLSCNSRTYEGEKISVNFDKIEEKEHLASTIFSDMELVKLETTTESVLSDIKNIKFYKDNIYIQDIIFKGVFVFDMKGKFLKKLDKYGRGADEYTSIDDFIIDETKNTLEVLNKKDNYIHIYDIDSFEIINTIKIPITFVFNFSKNDDLYYFQTNKARNLINRKYTTSEIIVYDPNRNKVYTLMENITEDNRHWEFYNIFTKNSNNKLFVSLAWEVDIYYLHKKNINPTIKINALQKGIPPEIKSSAYDVKMEYLQSNSMKNKKHFFKLLHKEENDIIIAYGIGYPPTICHYFNIDSGTKVISTKKILNDFPPFNLETIDVFGSDDGKIISALFPVDLKTETLINTGLKIEDNPALMLFKF
jgi:hypothetical protein